MLLKVISQENTQTLNAELRTVTIRIIYDLKKRRKRNTSVIKGHYLKKIFLLCPQSVHIVLLKRCRTF